MPLTKDLSLTAKHIAKLDYSQVVAYHPDCDIAIIQQNNAGKRVAPLGTVKSQGKIKTAGMGLTGDVLLGEGKYYLDVNFIDSDLFSRCPASITDAPVQSGMSGGGVYNENAELVGIISGISSSKFRLLDGRKLGNERTSVFVSTLYVKEWLIREVDNYNEEHSDNLTSTSFLSLTSSYKAEK
ncbi:trypsin-like serine protease [Enterovibrio baiacu]|uniref:trypsin-like serine protease n=1 Tax=Enterovibrio baiacu TaxID=2491023 RepID=UPI003D135854